MFNGVALPAEDCLVVVSFHEPSVQKSIEYKFNKISLFIESIFDVTALLFVFMVVFFHAVQCCVVCRVSV